MIKNNEPKVLFPLFFLHAIEKSILRKMYPDGREHIRTNGQG